MKHNLIKNPGILNCSLKGYIVCSYDELVRIFGEPNMPMSKYMEVEVGWDILFEDGTYAYIYNWKNGPEYLEDESIDIKKINEWNVGGNTSHAFELIKNEIEGTEKNG